MGSILAPSLAESLMRALYPQNARLDNDTLLLAQLQLEAVPCAQVQKGGSLPVTGSGKYTEHHSLCCELERHIVQGA